MRGTLEGSRSPTVGERQTSLVLRVLLGEKEQRERRGVQIGLLGRETERDRET